MLGGLLPRPKPQSTDAAIITLSDRLTHSTDFEDRKAAALALKGFSHENRELVASTALRGVLHALETDKEDRETRVALLETLVILFIKSSRLNEDFAESARRTRRQKNKHYVSPLLLAKSLRSDGATEAPGAVDEVSLWLTDEFTQKQEAVTNLLEFVSSTDMFTSLYALQLLSSLVVNRPDRARQAILQVPDGISTLVTALGSSRDMIRNETLLLLINLTNNNMDFQKLVAFEGAFDKIFSIIVEEGRVLYGGVSVETCLELLANMLEYNVSNQKLFTESQCVPKYASLLQVPENQEPWSDQAISNMTSFLHIARIFMVPDAEATKYNQDVFAKANVLLLALRMAFGPSTPVPVRVSALLSAASLIYGNHAQQESLSSIDVPYYDLRLSLNVQREPVVMPVIQALLNWALLLISTNMFDLRVASYMVLLAAFKHNDALKLTFFSEQTKIYSEQAEDGNANIIATLVDYDEDLKLNPFQLWFAAAVVIHLFEDSHEIKDQLRSFTIGDANLGQEEIKVLPALSGQLLNSLTFKEPVIAIGYLMLLIYWLFDDIEAVNEFSGELSVIQTLITYITAHRGTNSVIVESLATVLLGVAYDFTGTGSPLPRSEFHKLLHNTIGRDQYAQRIQRFRDSRELKDFEPSYLLGAPKGEHGLPLVDLEPTFVTLIQDNIARIQRAIDKDPTLEPSSRINLEMYEELKIELHNKVNSFAETQRIKESEIKSLTEQLAKLKKELQSATESLSGLMNTHEASKAEHSEATTKLENLQSEVKILSKSNTDLQRDLTVKESSLQAVSASFEKLKSEHQKQTTLFESVTKAKDKAEDGINKMSRELFGLTKAKEELEREIKKVQTDLADKSKLLASSQKSEKSLQEKLTGLEQALATEKDSLLQTRQINEKLIQKLEHTAEILKEKEDEEESLEQAMEQASKLQEELNAFASKYELLEKENKLVRSKLDSVKSDSQSNLKHKQAAEAQVQDLLSKATSLETQLKQANMASSSKYSELEAKYESLKAESVAHKNGNDEIQKQVLDLQSKLEASQKEIQLANTDNDTLKSENNKMHELSSKVTTLSEEVAISKQEEQKSKDNLDNFVALLLKSLGKENSKDKSLDTINSFVLELVAQQKAGSDELKMLQKKIADTSATDTGNQENGNANANTKSKKNKKSGKATGGVTSETETLREQITALTSEKEELNKNIEKFDSEIAQLRVELAETSSLKISIKTKNEKISELESEIKQLNEKSEDLDGLMFLLEDLTEKKNKYKAELRELKQDVSESEEDDDEDDDEE